MDNELLSDKENIGPEVHYTVSPVNAQGNIFVKEPCLVGPEGGAGGTPQTPPNTSRKRVSIHALRDTPPRSSYSSQMSGIFTSSTPHKAKTNAEIPPNISRDPLRIFEHFSQALQGRPIPSGSPNETDTALDKSGPLSDSDNHTTRTEDVQNSDESHIGVDDDDDVELQAGGCHVDSFSPTHDQQDNDYSASTSPDPLHNLSDPLSPLERAVAFAFSPFPSRAERRKTLNINIQLSPQPQKIDSSSRVIEPIENGDKDSSVDDWTGDEVFFHPFHSHRRQALNDRNNAQRYTESAASPLPSTPPRPSPAKLRRVGGSKKQQDPTPLLLPVRGPRAMRFLKSSRFHVPAGRSPPGTGVPLSMEEHPSSKGSDADDEDEGSDD